MPFATTGAPPFAGLGVVHSGVQLGLLALPGLPIGTTGGDGWDAVNCDGGAFMSAKG